MLCLVNSLHNLEKVHPFSKFDALTLQTKIFLLVPMKKYSRLGVESLS